MRYSNGLENCPDYQAYQDRIDQQEEDEARRETIQAEVMDDFEWELHIDPGSLAEMAVAILNREQEPKKLLEIQAYFFKTVEDTFEREVDRRMKD